jgi:lipopolysaccharide transport system permease protein
MKKTNSNQKEWDTLIQPRTSLLQLDLGEVWRYRDLLVMYIRRDIVTFYKQTILGPLWFVIQPLFTTLMFMFVFGGIAGIPTDGLPQPLFYMAGLLSWNYFSDCLTRCSDTFNANQQVFGKVYFPRLVVPFSIVISNLVKMGIQFALFLAIYLYYILCGYSVAINGHAILLPLLVILLAGLGLGFGLIITSLTTKYRDLRFLVTFGVQLWMYATPVIYPLSVMENTHQQYSWVITANPLTHIIEAFKYGFLGEGSFSWGGLTYSLIFTCIVLFLGCISFNRVQRSFMDVI